MKKLKTFLFYRLSLIRDNDKLPEFLVPVIDWIRYELFWVDDRQ